MLERAKWLRITKFKHDYQGFYEENWSVGGGLAPARPPSSVPDMQALGAMKDEKV